MHVLSASLNDVLGRTVAGAAARRATAKRLTLARRRRRRARSRHRQQRPHRADGRAARERGQMGEDARCASKRRRNGRLAEIRIGEDGPGLGQADLDRIGVRGRRLDGTSPGTGLGLGIAREIVCAEQRKHQLWRARRPAACWCRSDCRSPISERLAKPGEDRAPVPAIDYLTMRCVLRGSLRSHLRMREVGLRSPKRGQG